MRRTITSRKGNADPATAVRQQLTQHIAVDIRQAEVAALMAIDQLFVVDAETVEDFVEDGGGEE